MEIASYGFLAIAIGPPQAPAGGRPRGARQDRLRAGGAAGPATKSSQLIDAINWAVAENSRKGSPYYGKLDTSKDRGDGNVLRRNSGLRRRHRSAG